MSIEAMKQALEDYLSREMPAGTIIGDPKWWAEKIARVASQAIAEAEKHEVSQEPVAWIYPATDVIVRDFRINPKDVVCLPLYTHPQPKREWVGLTVMEAVELELATNHPREFAAAIEAKLKQKNI